MASINEAAVRCLEQNAKTVYIEGVQTLLRLLDNIIREPGNVKYRKIKLDNKIVKEKLLAVSGMRIVLNEIGFVEISGELNLSSNILIASIKKYRDFALQRLDYIKSGALPVTAQKSSEPDVIVAHSSSTGATKKLTVPKPYLGLSYLDKISAFGTVLTTVNPDLKHIELLSDSFMQYEDEHLQRYARSLIPIETLKESAMMKIRRIQKSIVKEQNNLPEPLFEDVFLNDLLDWFNATFFTWVDNIPCKVCNVLRSCEETMVENGVRVEIIKCCGETTKFYRYNDVSILLRTRRGRCGEYANCFTFLCRCLGYDARFVHGNFDHVWTEIYSHSQKRWIHFDPSENIFDAPLVYEHGWNRSVSYVIAFSYDDIQDVTWRYTSNYEATKTKRTKYSESELLQTILLLRKKRQQKISDARNKFLRKRNLIELATFLTPRQPTADEKAGRSSGSLDWRLSRGEQSNKREFVFTPNATEVALKQFNLRYSCANNLYETFVADTKEVLEMYKNWESCIFESENIFLKKETDWKMAYLARTEETDRAKILWKFDFSKHGMKIKAVDMKLLTKTYESGRVVVQFLDDNNKVVSAENLRMQSKFSLLVDMSGGKGDIAWQHTQLFRQELASKEYPFQLNITFF